MTYSIRKATFEDIPELIDVSHKAYEPIRQLGLNFTGAYPTKENVRENLTENQCYVLLKDDVIIATASIRMPWSKNPGPYGFPHIWWFATLPTYGNKGIGSRLLKHIEEEIILKEYHSPAVTLGTSDDHPWLIDMYINKGYQTFGSIDLSDNHTTQYMLKVLDSHRFEGFSTIRNRIEKPKKKIIFEGGVTNAD